MKNKLASAIMTGSSPNPLKQREQDDFYATPPYVTEQLLGLEEFDKNILEPCCGAGHISKVLHQHGYSVVSTDVEDRGFGETKDFLFEWNEWNGDIVTNPPYRQAEQFVQKSLQIIPEGHKVAMLLRIQFLEGKSRRELFRTAPPRIIYVSRSRISCWPGGDPNKQIGSAICYAWFIWTKGFKGDPVIKWFN